MKNGRASLLLLIMPMLVATMGSKAFAQQAASMEVGDNVTATIRDLDACPSDLSVFKLLIDGIDSGLTALGCDPAKKAVTFEVSPSASKVPAGPAWRAALGSFWNLGSTGYVRTLPVVVVAPKPGGGQFESDDINLRLRVIRGGWACFFTVFQFAAFTAALLILGNRTGLLRDANTTTVKTYRPYSLSRVQMAWWFAILFTSCIGLTFISGSWPTLGTTSLTLLGVSGFASVAAAGIDASPTRVVGASGGFWSDILTDAQGITLARFQLLVWNICLGLYFLKQVATNLVLPEFDATTLGLLGLSAATYLGFKVPEKNS